MRNWMIGTAVASFLVTVSPVAAQMPTDRVLRLSFDEAGRVNLTAQNVTARDILAEWARQCGCYIVNADRLAGPLLTTPVQFEQASQSQVLESLLRQAAGYVLTPRRPGVQSASNYETIYILAASNPIAGAYVPPPPAAVVPPPPTTGAPDDEIQPVRPDLPGTAPPAQAPAQPASSNPFGTRTGAFEPDRPSNQPTPNAPGMPATPPTPGRTVPVVPIVAVPSAP